MTIRLGAIEFINTLPVYWPFSPRLLAFYAKNTADDEGAALPFRIQKTFSGQVSDILGKPHVFRYAPERLLQNSLYHNPHPAFQELLYPQSFELSYGTPAQLNEAMLSGLLEISPVSSACYLRNPDRFTLLPELSVSSFGSVQSVLFASKVPFGPELMDLPVIPVPDSSETSVALLAHLLQLETGFDMRPWFKPYPAKMYQDILDTYGCALIIGDDALAFSAAEENEADDWHCVDLSTRWVALTGLPFVFAVWVAQKPWAESHPEQLAHIQQTLTGYRNFALEALHHPHTNPALQQAILQEAAIRSPLPQQRLDTYFTRSLDYQLTPAHHTALQQFSGYLVHHATPAVDIPV